MTKDEAIELMRNKPKDFGPDYYDAKAIFIALHDRYPTPEEEDKGLWDLCLEYLTPKFFYTESEMEIMTAVAMKHCERQKWDFLAADGQLGVVAQERFKILQEIEVQHAWNAALQFISVRRHIEAKTL